MDMELIILAITISIILALAPLRTKPRDEYLSPPAITKVIEPDNSTPFDTINGRYTDNHVNLDNMFQSQQVNTQEFLFDELDSSSDYRQDLSSDPLPSELIVSSPYEQVEYFEHEGRQYMAIITADTVIIREDS